MTSTIIRHTSATTPPGEWQRTMPIGWNGRVAAVSQQLGVFGPDQFGEDETLQGEDQGAKVPGNGNGNDTERRGEKNVDTLQNMHTVHTHTYVIICIYIYLFIYTYVYVCCLIIIYHHYLLLIVLIVTYCYYPYH